MKTLLLDQTLWDLCKDASGNIAVASNPYSVAQDVASAVKLFASELYYDTSLGIPYFGRILGQRPPVEFMRAQVVAAALRVPGVLEATCILLSIQDRGLSGQIRVTDKAGVTTNVQF